MQWTNTCMLCCLILIIVESVGQIPQKCKKLSPCICEDEYGRTVDLTPLGRLDGLPMYKDYLTTENKFPSFSFNPCYWFDEGTNNNSSCSKVAACMGLNGTNIDIGTQASAYFSHFDNGNLSLELQSRDHKYHTTVSLYCDYDVDNILRVVGDMGGNRIWLQLQSKHCCPKRQNTVDTKLIFEHAQTSLSLPTKMLTVTTHKEQCLICAKSLDVILFVVLALSIFTLAIVVSVYVVKKLKLGKITYSPVDNPDDMVHFDATNQVIV